MTAPNKLNEQELKDLLTSHPAWSLVEGPFVKRALAFADFDEAMRFINELADVARDLDHHPNLSNVYNQVELMLQTHDAGGITERDAAFVARCDALLGSYDGLS